MGFNNNFKMQKVFPLGFKFMAFFSCKFGSKALQGRFSSKDISIKKVYPDETLPLASTIHQ